MSWGICLVLTICGIPAWCGCCCPCDNMAVYRAPTGQMYNVNGAMIARPCLGKEGPGCC